MGTIKIYMSLLLFLTTEYVILFLLVIQFIINSNILNLQKITLNLFQRKEVVKWQ